MKRRRRTYASTDGYTLLEMMIAVALIAIIISIAITSFDAVKAKARYSQVRADMDAIAQSAYNDYSTNAIWAPLSFAAMPAVWATNGELRRWPTPPCPGWYYSWEDWSVFGFPVTQVTLRRANNTLLWGYCLDTVGGGNCQISDPSPFGTGSSAAELSTLKIKSVYCNE